MLDRYWLSLSKGWERFSTRFSTKLDNQRIGSRTHSLPAASERPLDVSDEKGDSLDEGMGKESPPSSHLVDRKIDRRELGVVVTFAGGISILFAGTLRAGFLAGFGVSLEESSMFGFQLLIPAGLGFSILLLLGGVTAALFGALRSGLGGYRYAIWVLLTCAALVFAIRAVGDDSWLGRGARMWMIESLPVLVLAIPASVFSYVFTSGLHDFMAESVSSRRFGLVGLSLVAVCSWFWSFLEIGPWPAVIALILVLLLAWLGHRQSSRLPHEQVTSLSRFSNRKFSFGFSIGVLLSGLLLAFAQQRNSSRLPTDYTGWLYNPRAMSVATLVIALIGIVLTTTIVSGWVRALWPPPKAMLLGASGIGLGWILLGAYQLGDGIGEEYRASRPDVQASLNGGSTPSGIMLGLSMKWVCMGTDATWKGGSPVLLLLQPGDYYITWDSERHTRRWPREGVFIGALTPPPNGSPENATC